MLGCAQPSCIISALDADGEFQEDSQFLTDAGGQSDGFFRDGDRALKRYRNQAAPKLIAVKNGQEKWSNSKVSRIARANLMNCRAHDETNGLVASNTLTIQDNREY